MKKWFKNLDDILRGRATQADRLSGRNLDIPIGGIFFLVIVLGVLYGICMGTFALFRGFEANDASVMQAGTMQLIASAVKVPLLFILTLFITFPSLYVFNALIGSQLGMRAVLKLLIAALGVNLAVLASLGPIVAFFSASTPNYSFVLLLNVVVFAVAGALSLGFLFQTLSRLSLIPGRRVKQPNRWETAEHQRSRIEAAKIQQARQGEPPEPLAEAKQETPAGASQPDVVFDESSSQTHSTLGPLDRPENSTGQHIRLIFGCWVIVYGLVGAQMGWVLRPFVGDPGSPFEWFRERDANFFQGVWHSIQNLFG